MIIRNFMMISLIYISYLIYFSICYDYKISNFIVDILKYKKKVTPPSKVSAFLCYNSDDIVHFTRVISQENVFTSIYNDPKRLPTLQHPNFGETVMFILDVSCSYSDALLMQASLSKLFDLPNHWLLLHDEFVADNNNNSYSLHNDNWMTMLQSLDLHVNTDMMISKRTSEEEFTLFEVYKTAQNHIMKSSVIGHWKMDLGFISLSDAIISNRRANLEKAPLTTAFVLSDNDTLNHLADLHNIHIDTVTKINYKVINHLCELLNASFRAIYGRSWGYPENDSWNGIVGHLVRKEADLAGTSFLFIAERAEVIDYILLLVPTKLSFVFKQPPLSSVTNVFTLPFSKEVWGYSIVLLLGCSLLLYLNFKWEIAHQNEQANTEILYDVTWFDVVMYVIGAVTEQGATFEPQKVPGRIISIFLYIFTIFLVTSYGACIVVLLQTPTTTIHTLKDLLDSPLELAAGDTLYNKFFFENAKHPLRREIYEKKIARKGKSHNYFNLSEGVSKLRNGLFAFHYEVGPVFQMISDTFLEDEKCGLSVMDFVEYNKAYQAVQKGSPYKEMITIAFRKIYERGIFSRAWNRYYAKLPECASGNSNFMNIGLVEFYPALLVLGYGMAASLVVLVFEILIHNKSVFIGSKKRTEFYNNNDNNIALI